MNNIGLADLALLKTGKSRSISAENPRGEQGAGGAAALSPCYPRRVNAGPDSSLRYTGKSSRTPIA
jgi:hypothetical protein